LPPGVKCAGTRTQPLIVPADGYRRAAPGLIRYFSHALQNALQGDVRLRPAKLQARAGMHAHAECHVLPGHAVPSAVRQL